MKVFTDINEIAELDDRSIQQCLKNLDNQTVAVCMAEASLKLRGPFFSNMSERASQMIKEQMKFNGKISQQNKEKYEEMMLETVNRVLKATKTKHRPKAFDAKVKNLLKTKTIESMTSEELGKVLVEFSDQARINGILSLENVCSLIQNDFLLGGIRLAIDGTDPELIQKFWGERRQRVVEERKLRIQQTVIAAHSINNGDHARILQLKLETLQPAATLDHILEQDMGADRKLGQIKTEFLKLVKQKPLSERNSVECVRPFCLMADYCRKAGILPFYDILREKDLGDAFFTESVLGFISNSAKRMEIRIDLEAEKRAKRIESLYNVLLQGVINVQMGHLPEVQTELVNAKLG